jgi:hypothetical protein
VQATSLEERVPEDLPSDSIQPPWLPKLASEEDMVGEEGEIWWAIGKEFAGSGLGGGLG